MGEHFELDDQGAPKLLGQEGGDDDGTPPDSPGIAAGGVPLVEAVPVWSAEEAQGVLQTVMNFGVFFYGPEWLCGPGDFYRSSQNAAQLLERVFPKASTGGPVGVGVDIAAVASDVAVSLRARRDLMKKGPKKPAEVLADLGLGDRPKVDPERSAPPRAPNAPVPPGESTPPAASAFKFSEELGQALGRQSGGVFADMGLA